MAAADGGLVRFGELDLLERANDKAGGVLPRQDEARTVRPVGLFYWGYNWTLTAWCELRDDFRSFRVDRIRELDVLEETFDPEPGKTLEDYLDRVEDD